MRIFRDAIEDKFSFRIRLDNEAKGGHCSALPGCCATSLRLLPRFFSHRSYSGGWPGWCSQPYRHWGAWQYERCTASNPKDHTSDLEERARTGALADRTIYLVRVVLQWGTKANVERRSRDLHPDYHYMVLAFLHPSPEVPGWLFMLHSYGQMPTLEVIYSCDRTVDT